MTLRYVLNCWLDLYDFEICTKLLVRFMVFNIQQYSVILWQSILLVVETTGNHRPVASHRQTLSHNVVLSTPRHEHESISDDRH